jgi:hypothetical protein
MNGVTVCVSTTCFSHQYVIEIALCDSRVWFIILNAVYPSNYCISELRFALLPPLI